MAGKLFCFLLVSSSLIIQSVAGETSAPALLRTRDPPSCTYNNVSPPGFVCGQQGTLKGSKASVILRTQARTQQACIQQCFDYGKQCVAFAYGPGTQCVLFNKQVTKQGFKKGNTGVRFYNRRCFKYTCTCPEDQMNCSGDCVNTDSDYYNCGSCGTSCTANESCQNGQCACSDGSMPDFQNDENNCGYCGNQCMNGNTCQGGNCACPSNLMDCDGACVDTSSDPGNCGGCGVTCPNDRCISSQCTDCTNGNYCSSNGSHDNYCGPGHANAQYCACVLEAGGNSGFCTDVASIYFCDNPSCSTTADCDTNEFCADTQSCICGDYRCVPINVAACANQASPKRLFRKRTS